MPCSVECETGEIVRENSAEWTLYSIAKDPKSEYADHFDMMDRKP